MVVAGLLLVGGWWGVVSNGGGGGRLSGWGVRRVRCLQEGGAVVE